MVVPSYVWVLVALYLLLLVSMGTVVVLENRQPAKTIAWLIVLTLLPVAGMVFFYFFGLDERRRHVLHRKNYALITQRMLEATREPQLRDIPAAYTPLVRMLDTHHRAVVTAANSVRLLPTGRDFVQALLREIYAAREHIHIEMYIIEDDAVGRLVRDALADRAREGVEVRVLYDDVGCWRVPNAFFRSMADAGILVGAFMEVRFPRLTRRVNYRDHHKLCVFDGRRGFIGGMNLALRYVTRRGGNNWRDAQLRVEGEAVGSMQRIFLSNWYFVTGRLRIEQRFFPQHADSPQGGSLVQVVNSSPISLYPQIMYAVTWLAQNARRYLYIATPYFMPTEPVLQALQTAALAGVDVRLLLPAKPDAFWLRWANDAYLADVLEAGVRVFLFRGGFMHAKLMASDDGCCSVGSANMDFRSFENNFEANAFVYDATLTAEVRDGLLADMAESDEVTLDEWNRRPVWRRYLESHTRVLSPLL